MSGSNVIAFAPALQRRRESERRRIALFGDPENDERYGGGGIDELWAGPHARGAGGRVIAFR
jgi:hypothetical protein